MTELTTVPPKHYNHVLEADEATAADLELFATKIQQVFKGQPCKRILMVQSCQIKEEIFHWENARQRRFPCYPPYGPGLLVRILEEAGYTVDIIDLDYEIQAHAHRVDEWAFRYDVWKDRLLTKIDGFLPDVVGVSCMFNGNHVGLKQVIQYVKGMHPSLPVVAGGVHVSLAFEQILQDVPELDFALLYESDQSFPYFLEVVNGRRSINDLAQIATVQEGKLVKITKRLLPEDLPYSPDYKDLPIDKYASVGRIGAYSFLRPVETPSATVLSVRGCRARCSFCSVRSVYGPGVRVRDYVGVVDEVERLHKTYGIRHIMWLDDDLFYDSPRAVALFEELAARKLPITWDATNGIIAAALTERLLKACVDSGCVGFNIGIESGNPQMLLEMKKPGTVQSFRKAAKLLHEHGPTVFTKGFLVIGFPNETLAMMKDTIDLCLELELDWYPIQILTPMPGTPVFQLMQDQGLLGDIPTTTLGKARTFTIGVTGSLAQRERAEKEQARGFANLFSGDLISVPRREQMEDIYMAMDHEINYKPILTMTDKGRLIKKQLMLQEICERMTTENPLGTLYLAIAEERLGNFQRAVDLYEQARQHLKASAFWQARFKTLGLNRLLLGAVV